MTVSINNITFDCGDARRVADFWAALLGWQVFYDDDPEVLVAPHFPAHGATTLLFIPVPEGKTAKNRMHLDLEPSTTRDEQVDEALALGATLVGDHRKEDGSGWVTLADPEGNEFCVERSTAERPAPGSKAWRLG